MRLPGRREEHDRTSRGFSLARGRRPTGAAEASCPLIFGRDVVLKEGDRSDRWFPDSSHPAARAQGVSGRGGPACISAPGFLRCAQPGGLRGQAVHPRRSCRALG